MKCRIKPFVISTEPKTFYIVQYRYWFWPFWINKRTDNDGDIAVWIELNKAIHVAQMMSNPLEY